jgi:4-amino-4-deoxy-L-arabinose transferase-like glycosyltransferase
MSAKKNHTRTISHRENVSLLLFICILCLLPFINKAFHIDDPLFIWVAKQIQTNPFDFYGFTANWYGAEMPMSEITKNPPGASYFIALAAFMFGWSEIALHLAFLIPACMVVIGTYYLAKELCEHPFLATLAAIATPVFLVSSTTIMCDVLMLAFWIWAIYFWRQGILKNNHTALVIASLLIAACGLTKYFGMSLIPLLITYSLFEKRKIGRWMLFMLIPLLALSVYQWATHVLYGKGLLLDAASYAASTREILRGNFVTKMLTGMAFIGGCMIPALFYSPLLWKKWILAAVALSISIIVFTLYQYTTVLNFTTPKSNNINWLFIGQLSLLCCAGVSYLALVGADIWKRHDADSFLLFLWAMGTLVFAIFVNWTINGRSILPVAPLSGILLVRQLSRQKGTDYHKHFVRLLLPLAPVLSIALLVTWADYRLANTARDAAANIYALYKQTSEPVWFQGHWGFQYYMEKVGAKAAALDSSNLKVGDIIVTPLNNTNVRNPSRDLFTPGQRYIVSTDGWLTTMNRRTGAGFYSDIWGPLPFVISRDTDEEYDVFRLIK